MIKNKFENAKLLRNKLKFYSFISLSNQKHNLFSYFKCRTLLTILPMLLFYVFYFLYKPVYCYFVKLNDANQTSFYQFIGFSENVDQVLFSKAFHKVFQFPKCFVLDLVAVIPYLTHGFLYFICIFRYAVLERENPQFYAFANIAGYSTLFMLFLQYLIPTAPPWYMDNYQNFNSTVIYNIQCLPVTYYETSV